MSILTVFDYLPVSSFIIRRGLDRYLNVNFVSEEDNKDMIDNYIDKSVQELLDEIYLCSFFISFDLFSYNVEPFDSKFATDSDLSDYNDFVKDLKKRYKNVKDMLYFLNQDEMNAVINEIDILMMVLFVDSMAYYSK